MLTCTLLVNLDGSDSASLIVGTDTVVLIVCVDLLVVWVVNSRFGIAVADVDIVLGKMLAVVVLINTGSLEVLVSTNGSPSNSYNKPL